MLFKKLLRTIKLYKAQFISMIIMIAIGVGIFVGFNMEWYSIDKNTSSFFESTGFADYRAMNESGFSEEEFTKVKNIEGVKDATRFISVNTIVKNTEKVLALTITENFNVSNFMLIGDGEEYDENSEDGMWLSKQYADKNNIKVGDEITIVYKELEITGKVKGLIKSSEYLICVPDETQLMPDFANYGFVYASPALMKKHLGMTFYPQINIISDLSKDKISEEIDKVLSKTTIVLSKEETVSYAQSQGEADEGKTMGSILPVLFLAIAILIMVTTMHRLAINEKTQIGILKALGFKDKKIVVHYTSFSTMIGVIGTIFGIGIGYLIAFYIMNPKGAMGTYMDMPSWHLYMPWFGWIVLVLINVFLTFVGYLSIRTMLKGSASEVLMPYKPKKMKPLLLEKTKGWQKLSFGTKWNLRDIMRHKARSLMTLFGVVGCTILVIGSLGMRDTMNDFVDLFYDQAINYETRINLTEATTKEEALALVEKYNGDYASTTSVKIKDKTFGLEIYHIENDYVKFINEDEEFIKLGDDGVYVCQRIMEKLNLKVNDTFEYSPYGDTKSYEVKIAGVILSLTESVIMTTNYAEKIGYNYHINQVFTKEKTVEKSSIISSPQSKSSIIKSFDTFMSIMNTMIILLIIAAMVLGAVVLYNLGTMSFMERYREMSTLKVVGFKDKRIGNLLISQNLWLSGIGVLLGIPLGVATLKFLIKKLASEYEMVPKVGVLTYFLTIILTLLLSLIVSVLIARKNRKIDMVESLKGID